MVSTHLIEYSTQDIWNSELRLIESFSFLQVRRGGLAAAEQKGSRLVALAFPHLVHLLFFPLAHWSFPWCSTERKEGHTWQLYVSSTEILSWSFHHWSATLFCSRHYEQEPDAQPSPSELNQHSKLLWFPLKPGGDRIFLQREWVRTNSAMTPAKETLSLVLSPLTARPSSHILDMHEELSGCGDGP